MLFELGPQYRESIEQRRGLQRLGKLALAPAHPGHLRITRTILSGAGAQSRLEATSGLVPIFSADRLGIAGVALRVLGAKRRELASSLRESGSRERGRVRPERDGIA